MFAHFPQTDHVFILRFWLEVASAWPDGARWRARISYINTGENFHADGLEAACGVVRSLLPDAT
jgi:hypothetical protein